MFDKVWDVFGLWSLKAYICYHTALLRSYTPIDILFDHGCFGMGEPDTVYHSPSFWSRNLLNKCTYSHMLPFAVYTPLSIPWPLSCPEHPPYDNWQSIPVFLCHTRYCNVSTEIPSCHNQQKKSLGKLQTKRWTI